MKARADFVRDDGPMSGRFEGKVVIVTGAGGGTGQVTAERFAVEGASVVVADVRGDAAEDVAAAIRAGGGSAEATTTDVSDEDSVKAMVAVALDRFGRLDVLDNNAALLTPDVHGRDTVLAELDLDVWTRTFAVNAAGTMLCCKHSVPAMQRSGGGAIVNIASASALVGDAVRSAYGSSKAAVVALTRYVATMYGADGIRCNAVAPGLIMTATSRAALSEEQLQAMAAERVLPWAADPEDIAATVLWLASDDARCITGQTVVVDSGTTAHRPMHAMKAWEAVLKAGGTGPG